MPAVDPTATTTDLSALAWVADELRRTLDVAHKAMRRHVKEAEAIGASDTDAVDPAVLRAARAQMHQGVGALELVRLPAAAQLLRASEAAVARLQQRPKLLHAQAVATVEQASFALLEYLSHLLARKALSALVLFPQYRAVQELAGAERIHPADLWQWEWHWRELPADPTAVAREADDRARSEMETLMLSMLREPSRSVMAAMSDLCAGLGGTARGHMANSWKLAAGFFQAQGLGILQADLYAKRIASRLLMQLRLAQKGQDDVSERLAKDLLFFCAHAQLPQTAANAPRWAAVRACYELDNTAVVDYETPRLGRYDPAWLAQGRKRVAAAKDVWSAVAGGELRRLGGLIEQFSLVGDSLRRLVPGGEPLATALQTSAQHVVHHAAAPAPALAMEVATSMLYLDAALEDAEFDHPDLPARVQRLAQRIDAARAGRATQPLEPWIEELYRRVSDHQTMGSVVQELRSSLSEVERQIDQYFRKPADRDLLIPVPSQLRAMRGVLSVLNMDHASQAVARMGADVDALATTTYDPQRPSEAGAFDRLADNLGALSFMIDMLSVQPHLAKSLFRFDAERGSLRTVMSQGERASAYAPLDAPTHSGAVLDPRLMGRAQQLAAEAVRDDVPIEVVTRDLERLSQHALLSDQPELAQTMDTVRAALDHAHDEDERRTVRAELAQVINDFAESTYASSLAPLQALGDVAAAPAPLPAAEAVDDEMREVFIEEAQEVVHNANESLRRLLEVPDDLAELTSVRRAFHTLKGSSRMVGLGDFGEAAWACEQLYNAQLAGNQPGNQALSPELHQFTQQALDHFDGWVQALAGHRDEGHNSEQLVQVADTLRQEGRLLPFGSAAAPAAAPQPPLDAAVTPAALPAEASAALPAALPAITPAAHAAPSSSVIEALAPTAAAPAPPEMLPVAEAQESEFDMAALFSGAVVATELPPAPAPAQAPAAAASEPSPGPLPEAAAQAEAEAAAPAHSAASQAASEPAPLPQVEAQPEAETVIAALPEPAPEPVYEPVLEPVLEAVHELVHEPEIEVPPPAENIKAIGPLRISIPLFNIYLNEADELSRRLCTELAEFNMQHHAPVADTPVALAHSLAGASATVGYGELSGLARALEHSLLASQRAGLASAQDAALFVDAADEMRRLLHQFAAGFLKDAPAPLMALLAAHEQECSRRATELGEQALRGAAEEQANAAAPAPAQPAQWPPEPALTLPPALDVDLDLDLDLNLEAEPKPAPVPEPEPEPAPIAVEPEAAPVLAAPPLPDTPHPEPQATLAVPVAAALAGVAGLSGLAFAGELPQPAQQAPLAAAADAFDDEDDIDAQDAVDEELYPIFMEEGEELIAQLHNQVRDWAREPGTERGAKAAMRTLHTFKGSARSAGAMRLGEIAHRLETAVEHALARGETQGPDVERLTARVDALASAFEGLRSGPATPAALASPASPASPALPAAAPAFALPVHLAPIELLPIAGVVHSAPVPAVAPPQAAPPQPAAHAAPTAGIDWARFAGAQAAPRVGLPERAAGAVAAVRVRASLLDRLVNQAGEVSITRSRLDGHARAMHASLGDLGENLVRLRKQLRDVELQAETQIASRLEAAKAAAQSFDPLEMDRFTRLQELTRMMAEAVNDVATVQRGLDRSLQATEDELAAQARLTRELQDDLLRTRMVEFEGLADRFYRVVRQAAKDSGKQVRLDIVGGAIEVDRGILDRMTAPFEHLLRNAVAHGIEDQAARQAAGKPALGTITVTVRHEGNEVDVEFRDDGAGLDLPRIRQRGLELGLIAAEQELEAAALVNLIFTPGFSTASNLSELSGRGVGMDVVRAEVSAVGGRIETASAPGLGSSFRLVLPLTTAVTQVVMLRCGALTVAVPSTLVEVVLRTPADQVNQAYANNSFSHAGQPLPFFWLGALLLDRTRGESSAKTQPVLVIRSASQRIALHVDEVLGNQEVVVKHLGPQLARLPGLVGMTLLASGSVALIYNPVALATLYGQAAHARLTAPVPQAAAPQPLRRAALVLVVDDSLTVRRVTQRLLAREGYRVTLAKDGLDALEQLAQEMPDVVLSDIEMPRMDGFDLVRNLRSDAQYAHLPVIMITSRIAQKHRDHAAELGVNHYLGKPYAEEELLGIIAHHAREAAAA